MTDHQNSSAESCDLIERLRNPMWAHGNIPFESPQLEQEENIAAMNEAAAEIERLRHDLDRHMQIAVDVLNDAQPAATPVAWMNREHIGAYMAGAPGGLAWASPEQTEFYDIALYASQPSPVATVEKCTLCAAEESPGFYTGCMVKDGNAPEWNCDGKGNLTRKDVSRSSAVKATAPWVCCNCDAPLSCAACGVEQPDDSEHYRKLQEENDRLRAVPQTAPVTVDWEEMPQTRRLLSTINQGIECTFDDSQVTIFIIDESDPSVGLDGGVHLSLSSTYEVIPISLLRDIKSAMGGDGPWERCLDIWRQTYEVK